ncbi:L-dopachrome tautomerase yellow-f2 [Eumeta japonica]|uniref:L-dopachrome tautomerase yellow-f2 n=1 Tax=Eumeta variegata TaxID=151549 RepID=A0A4C1X182_EUMVA|nr:L-dopachrome tautomerase yellow-f2 [Eumeta japonica]
MNSGVTPEWVAPGAGRPHRPALATPLDIDNNQQIQPPAIVVFDLSTNRQLFRYEFKDSDLPAENTPTGLASITVDVPDDRCGDAYAYVPDLTTFGLIVYSLRENDSWRLTHNYFSFNPTAGGLRVGDQRFQWSDGIFSITLSDANGQNCRTAYFHPLISTQEFAVSTCDLKNRNLVNDSSAWERFAMCLQLVGERGADTQSTMHGYHPRSRVMFYAEVGRNAVSCWHTGRPLAPADVAVLAQDNQRLLYPSGECATGGGRTCRCAINRVPLTAHWVAGPPKKKNGHN